MLISRFQVISFLSAVSLSLCCSCVAPTLSAPADAFAEVKPEFQGALQEQVQDQAAPAESSLWYGAQDAYGLLLQRARAWAPDARLYALSAQWVTRGGFSENWLATFVSEQEQAALSVSLAGDRLPQDLDAATQAYLASGKQAAIPNSAALSWALQQRPGQIFPLPAVRYQFFAAAGRFDWLIQNALEEFRFQELQGQDKRI